MKATILKPSEIDDDLAKLWRSFVGDSPVALNAFCAPEFVQAFGRHFPNARVAVLTLDGDVCGFFPYEDDRFGAVRAMGMGVTDVQMLVVRPGVQVSLGDLWRNYDVKSILMDRFFVSEGVVAPLRMEREWPSPYIELDDEYESWIARKRKASKSMFRRVLQKGRQLEKEVGEQRFVYGSRNHADLDLLMAWKSAQYKATGRFDRFSDQRFVNLCHDLLEIDAPEFGSVLVRLDAGNQPMALEFGLRSRKRITGWFPAYNVEFSPYSPGNVCMLRQIESLIADGIKMMDLGVGAAQYKESFKDGDFILKSGYWARPSLASLWQVPRFVTVQGATEFVASRPRLAAAARGALNRVGRLRTSM